MFEVQEQPVVLSARHVGVEGDCRSSRRDTVTGMTVRMHMEICEVGGTQRDQMPVRGKVGLQVRDRDSVKTDRERELRCLAGMGRASRETV